MSRRNGKEEKEIKEATDKEEHGCEDTKSGRLEVKGGREVSYKTENIKEEDEREEQSL